jgi:3-oxoacyl-[acyl-carrier protein] reductase
VKNILVTGASRGLGLRITRILLEEADTKVFAVSRKTSDDLNVLLAEYPERLSYKNFDLTHSGAVKEELFDAFLPKNTALHGYVNNAALAYDDIITNLNLEKLMEMYHVNVFAPFMITKSVVRNMLLHRIKGSIVHISSISVHTGYKGLAMYASSKGALEAFSKNTAREWGEIGIRSNCIVAGFMETDMSSSLNSDQKDRIYKRTSLKQPTSPNSVAATTAFLLSEQASSITGQTIFVDSGTI